MMNAKDFSLGDRVVYTGEIYGAIPGAYDEHGEGVIVYIGTGGGVSSFEGIRISVRWDISGFSLSYCERLQGEEDQADMNMDIRNFEVISRKEYTRTY